MFRIMNSFKHIKRLTLKEKDDLRKFLHKKKISKKRLKHTHTQKCDIKITGSNDILQVGNGSLSTALN